MPIHLPKQGSGHMRHPKTPPLSSTSMPPPTATTCKRLVVRSIACHKWSWGRQPLSFWKDILYALRSSVPPSSVHILFVYLPPKSLWIVLKTNVIKFDERNVRVNSLTQSPYTNCETSCSSFLLFR